MKMDELLFKKTFIHVVREDANFIWKLTSIFTSVSLIDKIRATMSGGLISHLIQKEETDW
jgi:hypothetical protein